MTGGRSIDDRISRWLEAEAAGTVPDRVLATTFEQTRELRQERGILLRPWRTGIRGRTMLLVAAVLTISVGALATAGALRHVAPQPSDVLDEVQQLGRIRIAIRPDHPQFSIGGSAAVGFDSDVATELARRMAVRDEVVVLDARAIVARTPAVWDAALPSVPSWTIDTSSFKVSSAYYYWPHWLVVSETSAATTVGDVAGGPVCAVDGDAGEAWLRGSYHGAAATPTTPITNSIVTASTDDECLSLLSSGAVVAAVTAHLSAADLQVRAGIRIIGGPDPEPRAVIVPAAPGGGRTSTGLAAAIDSALAAMRSDGTLTRFSQNRFGGADLTHP